MEHHLGSREYLRPGRTGAHYGDHQPAIADSAVTLDVASLI